MYSLLCFLAVANAAWSQVSLNGPGSYTANNQAKVSARRDFSMWCHNDGVYVFGGKTDTTRSNELWFWDSRWSWQPDTPVASRSGAAAWHLNGKLWLFGGRRDGSGNVSLGDFSSYDLTTRKWTSIGEVGPSPRYGAISWSYQNTLFLYGGKSDSSPLSDLWSYSISTGTWTQLTFTGYNPGALEDGEAVVVGDVAYFFGGNGDALSNSGITGLSLQTLVWTDIADTNGPPPREDHVMWYFNGFLYVFGGRDTDGPNGGIFSDLWSYNLATNEWNQLPNSGPNGRGGSGTCSDGNKVWLFGGANNDQLYNDMWVFGSGSDSDKNTHQEQNGVAIAALVISLITIFGVLTAAGCMYRRNYIRA